MLRRVRAPFGDRARVMFRFQEVLGFIGAFLSAAFGSFAFVEAAAVSADSDFIAAAAWAVRSLKDI